MDKLNALKMFVANALAGRGVLHTPLWSVVPYLADGRLVRLMAGYEIDPDSFGPHITCGLSQPPSSDGQSAGVHRLCQRFFE